MSNAKHFGTDYVPDFPIAISCVLGRYLLFDVKIVSYLRREHQLCGAMIGTLPQSPSQNLFLGLPVEIMPEEAQLLVEKGVGFILDDTRAHDQAVCDKAPARRADYIARIQNQTREVESLKAKEQAEAKRRGLSKRSSATGTPRANDSASISNVLDFEEQDAAIRVDGSELAVASELVDSESPVKLMTNPATSATYHVTPSTSRLLLPPTSPSPHTINTISNLPPSYPLYKHLNQNGYYITPGLRFGCQYAVYPGDPLRFHSHFLAVGREWDEEIDLMDIVGGGRLGTGVKKGFLVGGQEPGVEGRVRTFSVEWAVM